MGKRQAHQANEVYYGKDDGEGGGVLTDKLVQQQPNCAHKNQSKTAGFNNVSHLNVDYNIIWQIVQSEINNYSSVD